MSRYRERDITNPNRKEHVGQSVFHEAMECRGHKSNNILTLYSDRVSKITDLFFPSGSYKPDCNSTQYDLGKVLVEWELSPHYIVGTTSYVDEVSRTVYRSDFQFSGKELVSGTVSEVI